MDWSRRPASTAELRAAGELLKSNELVCGSSQTGKSTYALAEEALPLALAGGCHLDLKDPHRSFGERLATQLLQRGLGDRLHVEDYGRLDWVSATALLEPSRSADPVVAEEE